MADDILLRSERLTKSFAGFVAVKDVSLEIKRGTVHALIGPNGAGKTTFFNLLTRFLTRPAAGLSTRGRTSPMPSRMKSHAWASCARFRYRRSSRI